jgi:threonine dehydratase
VFVPVGGGGLISGIAAVLKAADPSIHIVGCQPAASDVMLQSVEAGRVVAAEWRQTLSEGTVGGIEEGAVTLEPCRLWVDEWVTVEEEEIAAAVVDTLTHTAMQVEGEWGSKTAGVGAVPLLPLCMAGCPSLKQHPPAAACHPHPPAPALTQPHLSAVAGASGVAIAAFNKLAPSLHNKHSVIIVCGGNMSREGMERVYEVAGVDRTGKQRPRRQAATA